MASNNFVGRLNEMAQTSKWKAPVYVECAPSSGTMFGFGSECRVLELKTVGKYLMVVMMLCFKPFQLLLSSLRLLTNVLYLHILLPCLPVDIVMYRHARASFSSGKFHCKAEI